MTKNCNSFYKVQSGDGCYDIANQYGISLDNFYAYNPAVGDDCSKLCPDNLVCVGIQESCSIDVTFKTTHSTEWGESVWVVGSVPELGSWDVSKSLMMTGSSGPDSSTNWQTTVQLSADTQVSYKLVKLQTDGSPMWEDDPNRDFLTPSCGGADVQEGGRWHDGVATTCTKVDVVFEVTARTAYGGAVYVIGSVPEVGFWDTGAAVALAADMYTRQIPSGRVLSASLRGKMCNTSLSRSVWTVASLGRMIQTVRSLFQQTAMLPRCRVEPFSNRAAS
jgi:hypothetical protein